MLHRAFAAGYDRDGFRLVHFSVQGNHVHMICEADARQALSRAVQRLAIRMAKGLNRVMKRHGKVFSDRYHCRILRKPTETRRAVAYVLNNRLKHAREFGWCVGFVGVDPYSSAASLEPRCTAPPRSWLLARVGTPVECALRLG